MKNGEVYPIVKRTAYWAVHDAVTRAWAFAFEEHRIMLWMMCQGMNGAVDGAVDGSKFKDPPHPGLGHYLDRVAR